MLFLHTLLVENLGVIKKYKVYPNCVIYINPRLILNLLLGFCLLVLLTALSAPINAQTSEVEDSLEQLLSVSSQESERISLMNELSKRLLDVEPIQSLTYAEEALKLSISSNNKEQELKALFNIGVNYYNSGDQKAKAIRHFERGEKIAKENGLKHLQADYLMKLANWYRYQQKDSTKTVNYLLKSIEVSKEANYHYGTGRSYAKLASFYTRYKDVQLSKEYLKSAAEFYLKIENGREEIAHYYDEVGNKIWGFYPQMSMELFFEGIKYSDSYPNLKVSLAKAYIAIKEPEMALKYLNEALNLLETTPYPRVKGIATSLLAEVYLQQKDYTAALQACNDGIELLSPVSQPSKSALPALLRTKGTLMKIRNDEKLAVEYFKMSIEEGYKINEYFDVLKSNIALGKFYASRMPSKGLEYCEFALSEAIVNNHTSLEIDACECLYNINKNTQNYSKALGYFEQKNQLSDSLSTLKVEYALDINSQLAQKDKEIAQESYLKDINEEKLNSQTTLSRILFFSMCIGLLLIGLLLSGLKRIRKQNIEITKKTTELQNANDNLATSNEELERFAYVASHDLKSPLNTIIGFAGLLRKKLANESSDAEEYINYIEKSGSRMSRLIRDILEYSKLSSKEAVDHEVISLNDMVTEISHLVNSKAKPVYIEASTLPNIKWNHSKIFLLFKNLIENGLKYNDSDNPTIKLSFSNSGINKVHIEDNGIGIKKEHFDKIFIMFNRLHNQDKYEGTGLGLATCKKIVDEFNGKIEVESQIDKGTTFSIEIPADVLSHQ